MTRGARPRNRPRGERVLHGLWRLRLPLPRGVPNCNAWAIAAGSGLVLIDCGMHHASALADIERALAECRLSLEQVQLLVCTHAHPDHCGQAADIVERTGCQVWMHRGFQHRAEWRADADDAVQQRARLDALAGVPPSILDAWREHRAEDMAHFGRPVTPSRLLRTGDELGTNLGRWVVYETPGHSPSHVVLHQPDRRLLLSGDHLMGIVSLYFEYGYTPDPVGEFLRSLDLAQSLKPRLGLSGHGRTFTNIPTVIAANRAEVEDRLATTVGILERVGAATGYDVMRELYGDPPEPLFVTWWLDTTLAYLRRLEVTQRARCLSGDPERWTAARVASRAS